MAANSDAILDYFDSVPILTKRLIRENSGALLSKDYSSRKWYYNTSGGSTGELVRIVQDRTYSKWILATIRYYYENIVGIDELGTKKILLWGSEKDIIEGTMGLKARTINWLTNTTFLNSFRMTQVDMEKFTKTINQKKPDLIRGYAGSLVELCRFIESQRLTVHHPKVVISAAESLTDEMRLQIERVFRTKVFNFYGSREISAIAGECANGLLHVFSFNNFLELLDSNNKVVKEGETGRVIITTLHNYSMPLIRYEIGDMAVLGSTACSCGNPLPTLRKVTGRITDNFITKEKTVVYGEYFTHLFYSVKWVKSFQIIQEDYEKIRIIVNPIGTVVDYERRYIDSMIKRVMGKNCLIIWEFVDEMSISKSGKNLYTKSLIHQR
jgi:phenylacetate-CoA ligase